MPVSNLTRTKRAARYEAGQCVVYSCSIPRGNGIRCPEHLRHAVEQNRIRNQSPDNRAKIAASTRLLRKERKDAGLCVHCGAHPGVGSARCSSCLDLRRISTTERRAERIERGICADCGKSPIAVASLSRCGDCVHYRARRDAEQFGSGIIGTLMSEHPERFNPDACAICGNAPGPNKALALDHCHLTGIFRGLLCGSCNIALGFFRDKVTSLKAAVVYLEGFLALSLQEAALDV